MPVANKSRFNEPLRQLTSLGWVALTVLTGQALSEFVVPSSYMEFRFFALFGTIVGLAGANLLNVSRFILLMLLVSCLFVGWGACAYFHILVGTGAEAGVKLYIALSFLLVLAFTSLGAALRMAGLTSETREGSNEDRTDRSGQD